MRITIILFCFLFICLQETKSQSVYVNADMHLYMGELQTGSLAGSIGYEHLSPKVFYGFGFSYVIPFSFSYDSELDPIDESTRPSTVWTSSSVKPKDFRIFSKYTLGRDSREKWFFFCYADMTVGITTIKTEVSDYNHDKYYGPSDSKDLLITYYGSIGLGFERRFGEMSVYLYPAISLAANMVSSGTATYAMEYNMPTFFTLNIGVKQYFAKDFKRKFGKPERKRK